jgi:hypothetical protein
MTGPKRVTEKQLVANRANARLSTGPRTSEGRARSRWNALKHGALAQAVIPPALEPFESRQAYEELHDVLRDELGPATALEEMLVERIATSYWRLARLLRAESAAIARRQRDGSAEDARAYAHYPFSVPTAYETLTYRVRQLSGSLGNKRERRALMTSEDERWRDASDEEVLAGAQSLLEEWEDQLAVEQKQESSIDAGRHSIPDLPDALNLARYETTLERQIYRALEALERLQRLRAGEIIPAPLQLSVDLDVTGGDGGMAGDGCSDDDGHSGRDIE